MTEQSKSTKPFELEKAGNIFYSLLPVFDLVRANGHNLCNLSKQSEEATYGHPWMPPGFQKQQVHLNIS